MVPDEFRKLAQTLARNPNPAERRTAISRAYYASLNQAVAFLLRLGAKLKRTKEIHNDVRQHLHWSSNSKLIEVQSALRKLFLRRGDADYRLDNKEVERKTAVDKSLSEMNGVFSRLGTVQENREALEMAKEKIRARGEMERGSLAQKL